MPFTTIFSIFCVGSLHPWLLSALLCLRENGYNESFNGRLRDEFLTGELFYTLKEAQMMIEQWWHHHNHIRPLTSHSQMTYFLPRSLDSIWGVDQLLPAAREDLEIIGKVAAPEICRLVNAQ